MTCEICRHEHNGFINYFLNESPHTLNRISMFYELDIDALKYHHEHCMKIPARKLSDYGS